MLLCTFKVLEFCTRIVCVVLSCFADCAHAQWHYIMRVECASNRVCAGMSGGGSREDQLAEGILGILGPAVEHVDQKIADVR